MIQKQSRMSKQKQRRKDKDIPLGSGGYVYSTNPDFPLENTANQQEATPVGEQKLRIWLETKNRGGKAATVIKGYAGPEVDLKDLGKQLKNHCGTGGAVKDQEIIIQGDQRDKVLAWLQKAGYKQSKVAGK